MELHKNWHVSEQKLADLKLMDKETLTAVIKSKGLANGLPTKTANEINNAIYGKINPIGTKPKTAKANTSKNKTRNRKDNKE